MGEQTAQHTDGHMQAAQGSKQGRGKHKQQATVQVVQQPAMQQERVKASAGQGSQVKQQKNLPVQVKHETDFKNVNGQQNRPQDPKRNKRQPALRVQTPVAEQVDKQAELPGEATASVYEDFYRMLGYRFSDEALLRLAFTHCSSCGTAGQNNQRLEYLGDAVLEFVVSERVYNASEVDEGHLTRMRANVVCEASLAQAAQTLNLGDLLQLGKGEESTGGREKASILADAMEAIIGAVYLDGGIRGARKCIRKALGKKMDEAVHEGGGQDYKTQLQHLCNVKKLQAPHYALVETLGPAHDRAFTIGIMLGQQEVSRATGRSKKEAEQLAAKKAVTQLKKKKKR